MFEHDRSALNSGDAQRQAYVDEFKAMWDIVGGTDFAVASTPEELIDKAIQYGATEKQVRSLLALQQSFKEIEAGTERMRNDPEYAAETEREAAQFDQWLENTSNSDNGIGYRLLRFIRALLR